MERLLVLGSLNLEDDSEKSGNVTPIREEIEHVTDSVEVHEICNENVGKEQHGEDGLDDQIPGVADAHNIALVELGAFIILREKGFLLFWWNDHSLETWFARSFLDDDVLLSFDVNHIYLIFIILI